MNKIALTQFSYHIIYKLWTKSASPSQFLGKSKQKGKEMDENHKLFGLDQEKGEKKGSKPFEKKEKGMNWIFIKRV